MEPLIPSRGVVFGNKNGNSPDTSGVSVWSGKIGRQVRRRFRKFSSLQTVLFLVLTVVHHSIRDLKTLLYTAFEKFRRWDCHWLRSGCISCIWRNIMLAIELWAQTWSFSSFRSVSFSCRISIVRTIKIYDKLLSGSQKSHYQPYGYVWVP